MDDLTAFVKARLDEDEAIAQAAASEAGPDWTWDRETRDGYLRTPGGTIMADALNVEDEQFRPHVARHDPARVLREVAAKRKRLAAYTAARAAADRYDDQYMAGVASGLADAIKDDASAWNDHPDYDQKWST
jgi:hypothetical protein